MTCKCFCDLEFSVISKIRMYVETSLIIFDRWGGDGSGINRGGAREKKNLQMFG